MSGMIINHNLGAMGALNALNQNSNALNAALQKLSTGKRINSAADDAAGLSISQKMQSQINGLGQASSNVQDGISMLQTAEGALGQTQDILQRMNQLAVQASNGTNTTSDTQAIQSEMNQLTDEINRIGNTTQFNTKNLLQGSTAPAVTSTAANTTITQGATGVASGAVSGLNTLAKSVVGVASSTTVQGQTSAATGAVGNFAVTTTSIKGQDAAVTVANGLTFTANNTGNSLNGTQINIVQGTGTSTTSSMSLSGSTYTITVGTDANGNSLAIDRGTLYNQVSSAISSYATANAGWSAGSSGFSVAVPTDTATPLSNIATSGSFASGVTEQDGSYSFDITKAVKEAGDTISIGGQTFTAVNGAADATKGQFDISSDSATTEAGSLLSAIQANSTLSAHYTAANPSGSTITLTENTNQATGVDLTAPTTAGSGTNNVLTINNGGGQNLNTVTLVQGSTTTGAAAATGTVDTSFQVTAGQTGTELNGVKIAFGTISSSGAADNLTSSYDASTQTLTINGSLATTDTSSSTAFTSIIQNGLKNAGFSQAGTITVAAGAAITSSTIASAFSNKTITFGDTANGGATGITAVTADTLKVDENSGNLTIYLANSTPSKNSAANIQAAIQSLGNVSGIDFSKYTATSSGNWDTSEIGGDINKSIGTLVGGTAAVDGQYSTTLTKAFAAGDTVNIAGQTFTAVQSGADSTKGQFNVGDGTTASQAASLIDAINLNKTVGSQYTASASGSTITLKENAPSGKDLSASSLSVSATGTQGQYSISPDTLLTDGGSFSIDGQTIRVSSKPQDTGYSDGTAIQQASTLSDQTNELASAINNNSNLNGKYTASVDSSGNLLLTQKVGSSTAPTVTETTSTKGDFTANFQIGANSGQSMTINIGDMRAEALGISGDGTTSTVTASNGQVASFVETADVNNGTDNNNTQYSLDVSTSGKASAAISVIQDAINSVSQQRSTLGAYENRLNYTMSNLATSQQNLTSAESSITDTDMAKTMANYTKDNVLQQAAVSMLAQANQQPQLVLKLLG